MKRCRSGLHEMTETNTFVDSAGDVRCRACRLASRRRFQQRHRRRKRIAALMQAPPPPPRHFVAGYCPECSSPFVDRQPDGTYCSRACRGRHVRRRARNQPVAKAHHQERKRQRRREVGEEFSVDLVGNRDEWCCGICGSSVDANLDRITHERGATVDHIVPLSRGGSHELSNVQLAHRCCNSAKGDRAAA